MLDKHSKSHNLSASKLLPQTAQTLTQISCSGSPDYSLYQSQSITEQELIQQTLAHCNLEWMLERLQKVKVEAASIQKQRKSHTGQQEGEQGKTGIGQIVKGFEQASGEVTSMLAKVRKCRQALNSKIFGLFTSRANKNNSNLIKKANIFKYKQALTTITNLNHSISHTLQGQQYFDMQRNKLQTSGLILVPSLIDKGLLNYIHKQVYELKKTVVIRGTANLNLIVQHFLGSSKSEEREEIYFKFKQYIVLKTYIDTRSMSNGEEAIDVLCQSNISEFLDRRIKLIEERELVKVKGLIQCNSKICSYFHEEIQRRVVSVMKSTINFIRKINDQNVYVDKYVIQKTLNKNKRMSSLKDFVLPAETAEFFTNQNFSKMVTHEEISDAIHQIQKMQRIFECFSSDFGLGLTANDLKEVVIYKSILLLIMPMIQLNGGILKIVSNDEQERKYHMLRSVYRNIQGYQNLFGSHLKSKVNSSLDMMHEYVQRTECDYEGTLKESESLPEIKFHIDKKENKMVKQMSIGEFYVNYNENYAQTYIYLINKLVNVPSKRAMKEQQADKKRIQKIEEFIMIWIQLVSQQICEHQLQEHHPANILKSVQFLQNKIIDSVEEKHEVQNRMDEIVVLLAPEKGKKGRGMEEDKKEQIYKSLIKLNLKTRNYSQLMEISRAIDAHQEMRTIHERMYEQVYSTFNFT